MATVFDNTEVRTSDLALYVQKSTGGYVFTANGTLQPLGGGWAATNYSGAATASLETIKDSAGTDVADAILITLQEPGLYAIDFTIGCSMPAATAANSRVQVGFNPVTVTAGPTYTADKPYYVSPTWILNAAVAVGTTAEDSLAGRAIINSATSSTWTVAGIQVSTSFLTAGTFIAQYPKSVFTVTKLASR
jgi:hypothetical protein